MKRFNSSSKIVKIVNNCQNLSEFVQTHLQTRLEAIWFATNLEKVWRVFFSILGIVMTRPKADVDIIDDENDVEDDEFDDFDDQSYEVERERVVNSLACSLFFFFSFFANNSHFITWTKVMVNQINNITKLTITIT